MKKNYISESEFDYLANTFSENKWSGFQSNIKCRLGNERTFEVKNTNKKLEARCSQIGGTISGRCTFVVTKIINK